MGDKPPHYKFFNKHLRYRKHLRTLGVVVVASHDRKKSRTQIEERGRTVMFVGYTDYDTLIIKLEMYTDLYISKPDKSF